MPRRSILFCPGCYYHFYNRGNNRQAIFFERENYIYLLQGMKQYLCEYLDILAYSLLPTHYHILSRVKNLPPDTSEFLENSEVSGIASNAVSLAMQKWIISYTKAINKRYTRTGALFQGQFQAKLIQSTPYLLNLCVYIHANPVKDGLITLPENWEFSNYPEWMNLRKGSLVNHGWINEQFGTPAEYREMVMNYINHRRLPEEVQKYVEMLEG